jgi:putative N6-adenine-specific DNA methylase
MNVTKILVTTNLYMAPMLRLELEQLGYPILRELQHGIETEGTFEDTIRLNRSLFTGHRVMFHLKDIHAKNPDLLYEQILKIPWQEWIDVDGYFRVDSAVRHPSIRDSRFANLKVKDAIVDKMKAEYGRRPDSGNEHKGASVFLYWNEKEGGIFLDTTGEPLNKRGYRLHKVAAPMQETLAAAILLQTKWNKKAPLINPMCGTGTIAIEAAMMACKKVPGLLRNHYAYQHLKKFDAESELSIVQMLRNDVKDPDEMFIYASDINPAAIRAAELNAIEAGVAHLIHFQITDFRDVDIPDCKQDGVIVMNAEYGEQLGDIKELKPLYNDIGKWFKKCYGYTAYLFTGNPELMKAVGLKPDDKIPFMNAKIECRLLKYTIYPPKEFA